MRTRLPLRTADVVMNAPFRVVLFIVDSDAHHFNALCTSWLTRPTIECHVKRSAGNELYEPCSCINRCIWYLWCLRNAFPHLNDSPIINMMDDLNVNVSMLSRTLRELPWCHELCGSFFCFSMNSSYLYLPNLAAIWQLPMTSRGCHVYAHAHSPQSPKYQSARCCVQPWLTTVIMIWLRRLWWAWAMVTHRLSLPWLN